MCHSYRKLLQRRCSLIAFESKSTAKTNNKVQMLNVAQREADAPPVQMATCTAPQCQFDNNAGALLDIHTHTHTHTQTDGLVIAHSDCNVNEVMLGGFDVAPNCRPFRN